MDEVKVSQLPETTNINDEDLIMLVQNGINKKAQAQKIKDMKDEVTVNFLYRGENKGDCTLIQTKGKNILIDLGATDSTTLISKLQEKEISKIDAIIISHFHGDHCMGYTSNYDGQNFINLINSAIDFSNCVCYFPPTPDYTQFLYGDTESTTNRSIEGATYIPTLEANIVAAAENKGLTIVHPTEGSVLQIDDNTSIKFLNCDTSNFTDYYDEVYKTTINGATKYITSYNNFSLVAELTHLDHKFLFTGDIEELAQEKIADELTYCDVLKVQHHGVDNTVNKEYYKKIKPKVAVIMNTVASQQNSYTIDGFKLLGTEIYSSNESNEIVIKSTKNTIFTNSEKGRADFKTNIVRGIEINDFSPVFTLDVNGTQILSGDNLNDYTTAGVYYASSGTIAASLSNTPVTDSAFKLIVEYLARTDRIVQTIKANNASTSAMWVRTNTGTWGAWKKINMENKVELFSGDLLSGSATLSESISNYDEVEIRYRVQDNLHSERLKVSEVTSRTDVVLSGININTTGSVLQLYTLKVGISGTTLKHDGCVALNVNTSTFAISAATLNCRILQVIGYKY